jgi:hypothetical protein
VNLLNLYTEARGINLVVVDIQPSYGDQGGFSRSFLGKFINFLNENEFAKVLYLYNGPDLGMESERDIKFWLIESGLDEDKLDDLDFFEKGYAFFRGWMDTGIDEDDIIEVGKYMIKKRIDDSRDIPDSVYEKMGLSTLIDYDDNIFIPEVVDEIKKINRPLLIGGGECECLREVELLFKMINKKYKLNRALIY